jgi:hypothetical protein
MWLFVAMGALALICAFVAGYFWGYRNGRAEIRAMLDQVTDELREFE